MKRSFTYLVGAVLLAAAIAAVILAMHNTNSGNKTSPASSAGVDHSVAFPNLSACKIFTLADAKKVLGDGAKGGQSNGGSSSDDLAVTTCSYTQDSGSNAPTSAGKSASLLVRAPKSGAGTTSNQNQFGPLRPADVQKVSGYGDNAYWDAQYGQLDILKNNAWYIISNGPTSPADRTLDQAKQLADILIDKM